MTLWLNTINSSTLSGRALHLMYKFNKQIARCNNSQTKILNLFEFPHVLAAQTSKAKLQMTYQPSKTLINFLASARFRGFSEKKRLNTCGFAREFLRFGMLYRPSKSLKRHGKSSNLHSKKMFCLANMSFAVSLLMSKQLVRVGIQTN